MKPDTTIAYCGYGYVGRAMSAFFVRHYEGLIYDPCCGLTYCSMEEINKKCDVAIVCVPTPVAEDGSCDTSIVEEVCSQLEASLIIIKSTVSPGTTDRIKEETGKDQIVFSPEYCGESSYWTPYAFHTDVKETPFFIFGGDEKYTSQCVDLYMPVVGPTKKYIQTSAKAAEMAKYMENCFYFSKIIFCYEMANICEASDVDFNEVRELWLNDPRINPMHTSVFAANEKPVSGKCLPKDLSALIKHSQEHGYFPAFLEEVETSNSRIGWIRKGLNKAEAREKYR